MSGRDAILSKIRASLGAGGDEAARKTAVAERLAGHPRGVIPERGHLPAAERLALFRDMAIKANASVATLAGYDALPDAVLTYLRERNLPASVRMGTDPRLAEAPWHEAATLEVKSGASDGEDVTGVSHALGAVAETGTLALTSGTDNPTTVNFLPEHHLVVVDAKDVTGDLESLWSALRTSRGDGSMPRTVNLVTGPSRSGDIEQVLLMGAHGPRSVHILVIDPEGTMPAERTP
ncbi:LutC/YkgG family protein [Pararhizobium mangrovi]|uniref:Lactate utilization protein n=1 Tax=Pararhizobium mangrovi TaxID=2590452 RepID=A0A506TY61_9HYPH|nr:lactate utilization protein [Pararhizobium mangrovi]TPW25901.1 lactate utilization protein [Pararhizobium mangrovi]